MTYTIDEQARRDRLTNAGIDPNVPAYVANPTATINAEALTPSRSMQLPPTQAEPDYRATLGSIPSMESIVSTPTTPAEQTTTDISSRLLKAYEKLTNKSATIDPSTGQISSLQTQTDAEAKVGLPGYQKSLTEVNAQIQSLQKEALAIPLQIQQEFQGRGATAGGVQPVETARLRENAIKSLGLAAMAQTLQGNISLAQAQANRAVDLEFAPMEAEIQYLSKALELNEANLTRQEKKQAELVKAQLTERTRLLEQQKADKNLIYNTSITASKYGADMQTVKAIQEARTPEEAVAAAGKFLQDPKAKYEMEEFRLNNILKKEQILTERAKRAEIGEPTATERKEMVADEQKRATAFEVAGSTLNLAKELRNMLNAGKGNSIIGGSRALNFGVALPGSDAATVQSIFDTLKDSLALGNIDKLKGAMSDKDIEFLRNTATSLRLNLGEERFKTELESIIKRMETKITENTFSTGEQSALDKVFGDTTPMSIPTNFDPSSFFKK